MLTNLFLPLLAVLTLVMLIGIVAVLSMPVSAAPSAPVSVAPLASSPSYQLNWDVTANAGSLLRTTSFTMYITTGIHVTTLMMGSSFTLIIGFWPGVFEHISTPFLPYITK